jgi:hypothetical protein
LLREFSISGADVDFASSNISLVRDGQRHSATDVVAIYDATYGSLRLSEPLYTKLDLLIARLRRAVDLTPKEMDLLSEDLVAKLENWHEGLGPDSVDGYLGLVGARGTPAEGWMQVFSPGSIVARRDIKNVLRDIEISAPEIVTIEGPPKLFYRYRVERSGSALVSGDNVEPVGDLWSMSYWSPTTGEYKDAVDDLVIPAERPVSLEDSMTTTET